MRKSLAIGVLGLGLVGAASAQSYGYNSYGYNQGSYGYNTQTYQNNGCTQERRESQTGGAIVGGLIGALAGGAIGNNIDNDKHDRRYRGYRGYRGYGYGHGYGHRRHKNDSNSGNVAAGAIVGGLLGAVAGSEIGKNNVKCRTYSSHAPQYGYRGDQNIAPPTRQAWPDQPATYPVAQPTRTTRTYPAPQPQPVYRDDRLYGGNNATPCETVTRVTRLPDGRQIREQIQDCQSSDVWYERDGKRVDGYY